MKGKEGRPAGVKAKLEHTVYGTTGCGNMFLDTQVLPFLVGVVIFSRLFLTY
jgi:hypothetical protein